MLRYRSKDVHGKPVSLREVNGGKFNIGFHQARDEMNVPCQSIQFGNDEDRAVNTAQRQRSRQCWPFVVTA